MIIKTYGKKPLLKRLFTKKFWYNMTKIDERIAESYPCEVY